MGSPLVTRGRDNKYYAAGLLSYTSPSCSGVSIYMSLTDYFDWINTEIRNTT